MTAALKITNKTVQEIATFFSYILCKISLASVFWYSKEVYIWTDFFGIISKHVSRHTTSSSFISNCYYSENECILKIFDLKIYIFSLCLKYYICYIIHIAQKGSVQKSSGCLFITSS